MRRSESEWGGKRKPLSRSPRGGWPLTKHFSCLYTHHPILKVKGCISIGFYVSFLSFFIKGVVFLIKVNTYAYFSELIRSKNSAFIIRFVRQFLPFKRCSTRLPVVLFRRWFPQNAETISNEISNIFNKTLAWQKSMLQRFRIYFSYFAWSPWLKVIESISLAAWQFLPN